jgi:hypothetical protein
MSNGGESSFDKVTKGFGASTTRSIAICDSGKLKNLFRYRCSNDTSTSGSGHQSSCNTATFSSDFDRDGMWVSNTGTPESSTDGNDTQFGEDHGSTDGSCDFLGAFDTETDMTIRITDDDERLETSSLTSARLFLYGANLGSQNNSK